MHEYARHLIASTAAQVLPCRGNSFKAAIARQFLPYCVSKVEDGRYILLGREYKPLGWPTRLKGFVDYNDPMFESMRVHIDDTDIVTSLYRLSSENGTFWYFYGHDGEPPPWRDVEAASRYIQKLRRVLETTHITREGAGP